MKKIIYTILIVSSLLLGSQTVHASATSTLVVDYYCDWENGVDAASTTNATLASSCHSNSGTFTWTSAATAAYYSASTTGLINVPVPIQTASGGAFYQASSTKTLAVDMNVKNQTTQVVIPSKNEMVMSGFIFSQIPKPLTGADQFWDLIDMDGSGQGAVLQLNASTTGSVTGLAYYVHTSNHNTSQGGTPTPVVQNKFYWYTMRWSLSRLAVDLSIYDPANNYALVGTSTSLLISDGTNTGVVTTAKYLNDHGLQVGVSNFYDNMMLDYTNVTYPLVPDTIAPQVQWVSPSGTVSGSSVLLNATSSDNSNLLGVQFFVGDNPIGAQIVATTTAANLIIGNAPISTATTTWDTTGVSNGSYTIYAVAEDTSGNYSTTSESVTVSNITAPTTVTNSATSITQTTSILNGQITTTNGQDATQSGFAYGTDPILSSVIATSTLGGQTGVAPFTSNISSLTCNVTYYSRAYATNSGGTGYGSIQPFTTTACSGVAVSNSGGGGGYSGGTPSSLFYPAVSLTSLTSTPITTESLVSQSTVKSLSGVSRILYITEKGNDVRILQKFLITIDYLFPGNTTGYFGTLTRQALKLYQRDHSIPSTGNFGPITKAFIEKNYIPSH